VLSWLLLITTRSDCDHTLPRRNGVAGDEGAWISMSVAWP
jgi:hypothetical protein